MPYYSSTTVFVEAALFLATTVALLFVEVALAAAASRTATAAAAETHFSGHLTRHA